MEQIEAFYTKHHYAYRNNRNNYHNLHTKTKDNIQMKPSQIIKQWIGSYQIRVVLREFSEKADLIVKHMHKHGEHSAQFEIKEDSVAFKLVAIHPHCGDELQYLKINLSEDSANLVRCAELMKKDLDA